jgi:hypothetical protein
VESCDIGSVHPETYANAWLLDQVEIDAGQDFPDSKSYGGCGEHDGVRRGGLRPRKSNHILVKGGGLLNVSNLK